MNKMSVNSYNAELRYARQSWSRFEQHSPGSMLAFKSQKNPQTFPLKLLMMFYFAGRYCDVCVVIEYCPYGNMLLFLRNKRDMYDPIWLPPSENPDKQFSMTDVVSAAFQVARAMEFLASRKVS